MSDHPTPKQNQESVRHYVNNNIASELSSLEPSKREAAANAVWQLATLDLQLNENLTAEQTPFIMGLPTQAMTLLSISKMALVAMCCIYPIC